MAAATTAVAAANVPQEILLDILLKLPPKSLIRFACVHKSWHDLISSQEFVTMHLNRTTLDGNNVSVAIICDQPFTLERVLYLVSHETYEISRPINTPCEISFDCFRFVDCCNGVICLTVGFSGARNYLLNPALNEIKRLPKPDPMTRTPRGNIAPCIGLGFGHDTLTNDYKMVRVYDSSYDSTRHVVHSSVDIYTLSNNSWRRKESAVDAVVLDNSYKGVRVNAFLHWGAVRLVNMEERELIIRFDVANEVFEDMELPNFPAHMRRSRWHPFLMKGLLSTVVNFGPESNRSFDIWVMKDYGATESWTKHITIESHLGFQRVISCGKHGELLLQDKNSRLVVYDQVTMETKRLKYFARAWPVEVIHYSESIVALKGSKFRGRSFFLHVLGLFCILLIAFLCSYFT